MTPQFVFVTGIARSGTTAFAELLNSHPQVCLGIERYKFNLLKQNSFTPDLFEAERFFDFKESDTNVLPEGSPKWTRIYDEMASKYPSALVCGDKIPDAIGQIGLVHKAFPTARYFWLIRDPVRVALSWQKRADNPNDKWPAHRNYQQAAEAWHKQHSALVEWISDPAIASRVCLLDYDRLFSGDAESADRVLNHMSVGHDRAFANFHKRLSDKYIQGIRGKKSPFTDEISQEIIRLSDPDLVKQVFQLCQS